MNSAKSAFLQQTTPNITLSNDAMSHARMVQACRFEWAAGPHNHSTSKPPTPTPAPLRVPASTSTYDTRSRRLVACRGRLYHQLACSHRIRTDLVEDCGPNCVEPYGSTSKVPFYCHECLEKECTEMWEARVAEHNASYPPIEGMSQEQYETWYDGRRQLEAQHARDRKIFESILKANTRPANTCSTFEASKQDREFAAELDSLSLSFFSSTDGSGSQTHQPQIRHRISLPSDASEQLHWGLNSLTIDRGSCGVEYSASTGGSGIPNLQPLTKDELWRRPRD